jgi:hypothetical protein
MLRDIQITNFLNFGFVRRRVISITSWWPFPCGKRNRRPFVTRLGDRESRNGPTEGEFSSAAGIPTLHSPFVQTTVYRCACGSAPVSRLTVPTADRSIETVFVRIRTAEEGLAKLYLFFCELVFMHHLSYLSLCIHCACFRYYSHFRKFKNGVNHKSHL